MFSKVALFLTASLALAAVAAPSDVSARDTCSTGPVQCCNSTQQSTPATATLLKALLGVDVGPVTGLLGVTCSPITGIGAAGNSCSAQTVCCKNNSFKGLVAVGCTPVNVNL